MGTAAAAAAIAERPSLALLFKKAPDKEGDIIGKKSEYSLNRFILNDFGWVQSLGFLIVE